MKYLLIVLFIAMVGCSLYGQRVEYGFVEFGYSVDGHDKIIKDTICATCVYDNDKGYVPTKYHWIKYNIFEPPGYFEIMKWYWSEFPKTYNGWRIEYEEVLYLHGYTEGVKHDKINLYCDTCDYLNKYTYDVTFSYGFDSKAELTVQQNRDTTNKYSAIKYPSK